MRRLGITGKLVLSSACIFLCLGVAVILYAISQLRATLYEEMLRRVEAQSLNWIEANTSQLILSGSPHTMERLVQELQQREGIAYVILVDPEGRELAAGGAPAGLARQIPGDEAAGLRSRPSLLRDERGRQYFELETPISTSGTGMSADLGTMFGLAAAGQTWGLLRVGVSKEVFDRRVGALVRRNAVLYGLLVLLALGVNIALARRMVTPITTMGRVANQIAAGHLDVRVDRGASLQDEVGELVRNFNRMAEKLAENREEMNLLYAGLEEKVRDRTRELEQANLRLRELDALKSHFLSTVSHEFRSPLTSIKAYAEILLDSNPDPPTRERFLEIIGHETDRMSRLITDLLDLAKIESGTASWRMSRADLREIIGQAAVPLTSVAGEKGIELRVAESEPQMVWGDADRLQQVVTNLVQNGIRFCDRGGRIEIRLERARSGGPCEQAGRDCARVAVEDTGPGVPPEDRERVFEKFYQGRSNCRAGGTGLGLAISKEIVVHHQGDIWVESELGRGSTFYFTVPLFLEEPAAAAVGAQPAGTG